MVNAVNYKGGQKKKLGFGLMVRKTSGVKLDGEVRRSREGGNGRGTVRTWS